MLTPSALLPRHLAAAQDPACALHSDSWEGYPYSQHELLKFACDNEVEALVFLSGDEHISSFTRAKVLISKRRKPASFIQPIAQRFTRLTLLPMRRRTIFWTAILFFFPHSTEGPYVAKVERNSPIEAMVSQLLR